jgi:hypothetical protein
MAVTVWWSSTAADPKLHLDPECSGLERVTPERRTKLVLSSLAAVAAHPYRPCRVCALEHVVVWAVGKNRTASPRRTLLTISSQPAIEVDHGRFRTNTVTETGAERLQRIADAAGLAVTHTAVGPVAYGFTPARAVNTVARNLRCATAPPRTAELLLPHTVTVFWTFLDDAQRGLNDDGAWSLTAAVCDDPALRRTLTRSRRSPRHLEHNH